MSNRISSRLPPHVIAEFGEDVRPLKPRQEPAGAQPTGDGDDQGGEEAGQLVAPLRGVVGAIHCRVARAAVAVEVRREDHAEE